MEQIEITTKDLMLYCNRMCMVVKDGDVLQKDFIYGFDYKNNKVICGNDTAYDSDHVFPILRKMEDITIEESVHISCDIMGYDKDEEMHEQWNHNDKRDIIEFGFIQFDTQDSIFMPQIISYLIKQGFNLHLLPHGSYVEISKGVVDVFPILKKFDLPKTFKE